MAMPAYIVAYTYTGMLYGRTCVLKKVCSLQAKFEKVPRDVAGCGQMWPDVARDVAGCATGGTK